LRSKQPQSRHCPTAAYDPKRTFSLIDYLPVGK
jgi:hypothetical protein